MHRYKIIIGSAMLAALSVLLQIYKIAYPWGGIIDIDVVGVPWVISAFVFGVSGGIITSLASAVGIALFAPTGFVGAVMKLLATLPMVLIVAFFAWKFGFSRKSLAASFIACLLVRPVSMTLLNYYWAIPLFFGIPTEQALAQFPAELFLIPNAILAAIDFWFAYLIVFKTSLRARLDAQN